MTRRFGVLATLGTASLLVFACSQNSNSGPPTGGTGGASQSGGTAGSSSAGGGGGSAGTSTAHGGSGGTSSSSQGGTATGGTKAGGAGGSISSGSGGTSAGGSSGNATGGRTGDGTGGARQGGAGGGTTIPDTGGAGGKNTGGSSTSVTGTGGTGAGGDTGSGGSTSSAVIPTTVASSGRNRFAFGDVIFEVDPKVGARVSKLSLGGTDMLPATGSDTTTWGAVFWTSPQSDWEEFWPPPAAIDNEPYSGGVSGSHLVLDSGAYAALGVSVSKDFSADSVTGWITIEYTIQASKALKAAPWENCRVPRGGLAFLPAGSSLSKGPLTMTESGGIVWFDDASKTATSASGEKAIADGSGGWMAYALGGNLLLRKFTDTPASAQAPDEGEDEIYPGSSFLELEVQGPYTSIPAGGTLTWTVAWRIIKIPSSVTVSAGSTSLADFAKEQAAL